ncbi:MAG: hypothetical protein ACXVMS_04430 [Flavisolibacter sp.]
MANTNDDREMRENKDKGKDKEPAFKPDAGTLHTNDPQKNMEGPVSSMVHKTGEAFESKESQGEADRKREEHM